MLELLWGFVYNCALMVVGIVVASIILPHVAGKAMIRGMAKAASEVFDEQARAVFAEKLKETFADSDVRALLYHVALKLFMDKDIASAIKGCSKKSENP